MHDRNSKAERIRAAFALLRKERLYNQSEVVAKLHTLQVGVSKASFSKLINGLEVGEKLTHEVSEGMLKLVRIELRQDYDLEQKAFVALPPEEGGEETVIRETDDSPSRPSVIFHGHGRLPVAEKMNFMREASTEIVEFGVRLATFTNYFHSRSSFEFRSHIERMLERGVDFKLYLLDPESNEASFYFRDRAKLLDAEVNSTEIIRRVLEELKKIRLAFENQDYKGGIQLYTYKHIPSQHFTIVDGPSRRGKMIVSHYLFGVNRADCPLVEIHKADNPQLYRLYYKSFKAISQNARLVGAV